MSDDLRLTKNGRKVVAAFEKAGIPVEVRAGTKHYLVYHRGELVYKFGQGSTVPGHAQRSLRRAIRKITAKRNR